MQPRPSADHLIARQIAYYRVRAPELELSHHEPTPELRAALDRGKTARGPLLDRSLDRRSRIFHGCRLHERFRDASLDALHQRVRHAGAEVLGVDRPEVELANRGARTAQLETQTVGFPRS